MCSKLADNLLQDVQLVDSLLAHLPQVVRFLCVYIVTTVYIAQIAVLLKTARENILPPETAPQ